LFCTSFFLSACHSFHSFFLAFFLSFLLISVSLAFTPFFLLPPPLSHSSFC
jgi:hypothetical protein